MRQCIDRPGRILLAIVVTALTLAVHQSAWAQTAQQFETLMKLRPLADKGDREAQFLLGGLYSRGEGLQQDDEKAAHWWRKAAEQGLADAQNELGAALADGRGVPADPNEAVLWYRKSAEQGLAVAQANLGTMYWNGTGVGRSQTQAIQWYRKAAEQGLGWAQFYLGDAYAKGQGVSTDYKKAVEWYRKSAEQDYTDAQYALGMLYRSGAAALSGSNTRETSAAYWLSRAAHNGHEQAETILDLMFQQLSKIRLPAAIAVRAQPDVKAAIIRNAGEREQAGVLSSSKNWLTVYLKDGRIVGYVSAGQLR